MKDHLLTVVFMSVIIALVFSTIFLFTLNFHEDDVKGYKIVDKTLKVYPKSSKYLILTEEESFELTDSFLSWKFNSTDQFSKLKIGKCYDFHLRGKRIEFFSSYRNIISFKEVKCGDKK